MRSFKESITYSQATPVKKTCFSNSEFELYINIIKDQFVKCRYEKTVVENRVKKVEKVNRKNCGWKPSQESWKSEQNVSFYWTK